MITFDMLIQEAGKLTKPSLFLSEKRNGDPIGMWRGDPLIKSPPKSEHLFSVNCNWLRENGFKLRQNISLFLHPSRPRRSCCSFVLHDEPFDAVVKNGCELYGECYDFWPPLEALHAHGPSHVRDAIAPKSPTSLLRQYADWFAARDPKHNRKLAAVLGGWPDRWPEDYDAGTYGRDGCSLALCTLWEAEPWIEVWEDTKGQIDVVPRGMPEDR